MRDIQVSPYINFQGQAREAMEFYQRVLGGNLDLQTGPEDRIVYWRLEAAGVLIIGVDGHPNFPPTVGDNMALAVGGTDKARLTEIFNGLAEGGKIKMPLTSQPSGAEVGWLMDRFGINWMVSIG